MNLPMAALLFNMWAAGFSTSSTLYSLLFVDVRGWRPTICTGSLAIACLVSASFMWSILP